MDASSEYSHQSGKRHRAKIRAAKRNNPKPEVAAQRSNDTSLGNQAKVSNIRCSNDRISLQPLKSNKIPVLETQIWEIYFTKEPQRSSKGGKHNQTKSSTKGQSSSSLATAIPRPPTKSDTPSTTNRDTPPHQKPNRISPYLSKELEVKRKLKRKAQTQVRADGRDLKCFRTMCPWGWDTDTMAPRDRHMMRGGGRLPYTAQKKKVQPKQLSFWRIEEWGTHRWRPRVST